MKKPQVSMFFLCTLGFLSVFLGTQACQGTSASTKPSQLESLQGRWEGTGPGGECSVTISGSSLHFYAREDHWYETTFSLLEDTEPTQLHATIVNATVDGEGHIGKEVVAIVAVEDGILKLATSVDVWAPEDGDPWARYADHYEFNERQREE